LIVALGFLATPALALQSTGKTEGSLAAQAEKAKKERAARRAAAGKAKTYTNEDLGGGGRPLNSGVDPASSSGSDEGEKDATAAKSSAETGKTDEQLRNEKQQQIQSQIEAQRKKLEIIDRVTAQAQGELGDLSNVTYGGRRQALMKAIEDGKAERAKAEQAIADLQEEARRMGASVSR
jgi:hypothetical protein